MVQYPHCDSNVIHHPDDQCKYCNDRPDLQIKRAFSGINFTGHYDDDKELCPAERVRPLETIEKWHGNVAMTPEQQAIDDAYWAEFERQLAEEFGEAPLPSGPVQRQWYEKYIDWGEFYALPNWRRPIWLFEVFVLHRR